MNKIEAAHMTTSSINNASPGDEEAMDSSETSTDIATQTPVVETAELAEQPPVDEPETDEDSFAALFESSLKEQPVVQRGQVVQGTVVAKDNDNVVIDVGSKAEGTVPLAEFVRNGDSDGPTIGDKIDVMVVSAGGQGGIRLSVSEARRRIGWQKLREAQEAESPIHVQVAAAVKGGYRIEFEGLNGFMPRSEADIDPHHQAELLLGKEFAVDILRVDRKQENVVVSRKNLLQGALEEKRQAFFSRVRLGERVSGTVRRLTDFGAFVDIDGVDALLHVSDISWRHLRHPSEMLNVGQSVTAEITRLNAEKAKISLSMRALQADPWQGVDEKYELGMRVTGTVRRLLEHGAIIELEPGVEGMIHRSELNWLRPDIRPSEVLTEGEVVDVAVLEIKPGKRRIALSLKAVSDNPWQAWLAEHPAGSRITGKIRNITDFGLFVGQEDGLDGLVHMGNLSWTGSGMEALENYKVGQEIDCVVLGVDVERQRISLGVKQLDEDPFELFLAGSGRGARVSGKVTAVDKGAARVEVAPGIEAVLPLREVPREQELKADDAVEAKIIEVDRRKRKVVLSLRQFLRDEERDAIRAYANGAPQGESAPSALALELQRKGLVGSQKASRSSRGK
ncbi:MAG: 30S ribosomal protein S1 [Mariprofundaceae bacterium]